ncbi:MAG: spore protease YyaC [Clostridiales bacterium]|nr:spore protease YyaC [Clostridiales bacterium]
MEWARRRWISGGYPFSADRSGTETASEPREMALPLCPALLARLLRDVWIRERSSFENSTFADSTALSDVRVPKPVILCIGTDRIIGDSLGPLTGSLLERHAGNEPALSVYGTLDATVHACNLAETLIQIKKKHPGSVVIAVDASLDNENKVGSVLVHPGSLKPGMGVKKDLPAVGDISITGIAGLQNSQPYLTLQTARLSLIMTMAEQISTCILEACRSHPVYGRNLSVISK